jgi:hypothetical protein
VFFFIIFIHVANEWKEKAELELGETNHIVNICCKQLRNLLAVKQTNGNDKDNKNGFLWNKRQDDAFLLRFLRAKKFDVDKAFKMVSY